MAKIVPLFSSSSGNAYYIEGNGDAILVDAGKNCKQIELALKENDLSMETVRAVFVTHEHSDHISALNVLLKKFPRPVFATRGTLTALEMQQRVPALSDLNVIEKKIAFGGFEVRRVETSHDAAESCGFFITTPDDRRCAVVTDTGFLTDDAKKALSSSDLAVVESNHDVDRLKTGPYPYPIKMRILSDLGHLSNGACADALPEFVESGLTRIILAHLSRENNTAILARDAALRSLEQMGMKQDLDFILDVAAPETLGKAMVF